MANPASQANDGPAGPPPETPTAGVGEVRLNPAAGVAAMMLPGLGHAILGRPKRGAYIAGGVLGLFLMGLLVGGIDAIDSREDRLWFYGQACVGPLTFAVDHLHQTRFKVLDPATQEPRTAVPGETRSPGGAAAPAPDGVRPPNLKGLGRVNELGTLAITLAGFMNLIAVFDALLPGRTLRRRTGGGAA
ncbi:MAG: DUF6677 family protein [Planctomycetota bacterium]